MRTKHRIILHSDLNCFYASVELMLNPDLRGKAVAVCGSTETRHGIILAKSQKAKEAGVKTAMANWEAREVCPGLIMVPPQYDQYLKYGALVRSIYERYTDYVEPFGMDEAWLDVTASQAMYGSGMDMAEAIRQTVKRELGLTVSIGVSFNKIFAKLGSDMKKPDAITNLPPEAVPEKIWPLPVSELLYVGRATTRKLHNVGIETIGDLAKARPQFLKDLLGVNGLALWTFAAGLDRSAVKHKDATVPVKSVGKGITCYDDLTDIEAVAWVMLDLCQDIGHRLRGHKLLATAVQIQIRGKSLHSYQYQCSLSFPTQSPLFIARRAKALFVKRYPWVTPVRAVCVRAIDLIPAQSPTQLSLFDDQQFIDKVDKVEEAVERIRYRYGKNAIRSAGLLRDLKMPDDGRDEVVMPGLMYQ